MSQVVLTVVIETNSSNFPTGVITESESADYGEWDDVSIAKAQEEDIFFEGSAAVSAKASNKSGEFYYDVGSGTELDFDTAGDEEGELIFFNLIVTTLGGLDTLANNGLSVRLYTDLNNYMDYVIAGTDVVNDGYRNLRYGRGGYVSFAIDPSLIGDENGTFDLGSVRYIGFHIDTTASAKAENIACDGIFVGSGVRVTDSDTDGWADLADYCSDHANRAWGMIHYDDTKSTIYSLGKIYVGDSGQTAVTSLTDTSRKIQFKHTYYWVSSAWEPMVKDGYLGMEFEDAGGYATTFTDGVIVGTDKGRSGSLIEGAQERTTYVDFSGLTNAASSVLLYNTTFRNITGGISLGDDSDWDCFSVVFDACGQIDPVGAVVIRNCIIQNYTGTEGAFLWASGVAIDFKYSQLIANYDVGNDSAAIEFTGSDAAETLEGLIFTGNTKDCLNSSVTDKTISLTESSNASTKREETGTITYSNDVTLSVTVKRNDTKAAIEFVEVAVYKSDDDSELMNEQTNASGLASQSYNYPGGDSVGIYWRVREVPTADPQFIPDSSEDEVTTDGFSRTVFLKNAPYVDDVSS